MDTKTQCPSWWPVWDTLAPVQSEPSQPGFSPPALCLTSTPPLKSTPGTFSMILPLCLLHCVCVSQGIGMMHSDSCLQAVPCRRENNVFLMRKHAHKKEGVKNENKTAGSFPQKKYRTHLVTLTFSLSFYNLTSSYALSTSASGVVQKLCHGSFFVLGSSKTLP